MKIRPVGAEMLRACGRADMTKLRATFRNIANAPKYEKFRKVCRRKRALHGKINTKPILKGKARKGMDWIRLSLLRTWIRLYNERANATSNSVKCAAFTGQSINEQHRGLRVSVRRNRDFNFLVLSLPTFRRNVSLYLQSLKWEANSLRWSKTPRLFMETKHSSPNLQLSANEPYPEPPATSAHYVTPRV